MAVLDLNHGRQDLSCGMWDLVPRPGVDPGPLGWEHRIPATRPPGKSLTSVVSSLLNYSPGLLVLESESVVSQVLPGSLVVYCRRAVYSPITVHFFFF